MDTTTEFRTPQGAAEDRLGTRPPPPGEHGNQVPGEPGFSAGDIGAMRTGGAFDA